MAEQKRDYYELLGLSKSATDDEIKKAYRQQAKENHPDLNPDDKAAEARFKSVNEAYEVLSDKDKKARYDQFGHAGVDPNFGASGGYEGGFGGFGDIFSDIFGGGFGDIFGGGQTASRRNAPQKGENIRQNVSISFEEAAFGCEKEMGIYRLEDCKICGGNGCAPGTTPEVCSRCGGSGTVRVQQRTAFGTIASTTSCSDCGGTGKIIHSPCSACKGSGSVRKNQKITARIPAGIDNGQTISMRGQGNVGKNGGPNGDILVNVSVRPHELFEREGTSVAYDMPISFVQAALGTETEVPTLDGKVKYTIPEGTQTGTVFRLKGKGIPFLNGKGRGDQYVNITVKVPKNLTGEQKELLRAFGRATGEEKNVQNPKIFDKMKKKK